MKRYVAVVKEKGKSRAISGNPELIRRLLKKLDDNENQPLKEFIEKDEGFLSLKKELEERLAIDVSNYPTIEDVMEGDSDDSVIINEMPFREIQNSDIQLNTEIVSDDSDGLLSDEEEGRARGRARVNIRPGGLDIDDDDLEDENEKGNFLSDDEDEEPLEQINDAFKSTIVLNGNFGEMFGKEEEDSEELKDDSRDDDLQ